MPYQTLVDVQFLGAIALQITVAAAMYRKRLYTQAKYFFAYVVWQTFSAATLYLVLRANHITYYVYGYWITDAIDIVLGAAIVIETFRHMFASYSGILRFARLVFIVSALLLGVASTLFLFFYHGQPRPLIMTIVLVTERSVRVIQLGLIVVLFAIARYLRLRWKNYQFGIALGFGFYALATLLLLLVTVTSSRPVTPLLNLLWGTGYCASVVIWTFYVLQPDAATIPIVSLPSHELQRWDEALTQLLGRKPSSTFSATAD